MIALAEGTKPLYKDASLDLKKIMNPSYWNSIKSPTFKSFIISLSTLDLNSNFVIEPKELETPQADRMCHLFRKRAVTLVTNVMLVSSLMFIVTINVLLTQPQVTQIPFGSYEGGASSSSTLPYGTAGWISKPVAGTLLLLRTVSACCAMVMALTSIVIGVAYTATLTTWLQTSIDVVAWNMHHKMMLPVYPQVLSCWFVVLSMECTIFLSYPVIIGVVCFLTITATWGGLNYFVFLVYTKSFLTRLDEKALAVWHEIEAHMADTFGNTSSSSSNDRRLPVNSASSPAATSGAAAAGGAGGFDASQGSRL